MSGLMPAWRRSLASLGVLLELARVRRSLHRPSTVSTCYVICASPRSGSTLLCEALTRTGRAGFPDEWALPAAHPVLRRLLRDAPAFGAPGYLATVIRRTATPNGIFGIKIMWREFERLLADPEAMALFGADFRGTPLMPDIRYIRLKRADHVRQAISHLLARESGLWHAFGFRDGGKLRNRREQAEAALADPTARAALLEHFDQLLASVEAHEAAWDRFLAEHGIEPLLVEYEAMVADLAGTVRQVLGFLGQPVARLPDYRHSFHRKLADSASDAILEAIVERERIPA